MKISIEFNDFDPNDPDIDFHKNRLNYWGILKKIRTEYLANSTQEQFDFSEYMEKNYGIKMNIVDGQITDKYDIVDEKLYIFFLLKWM